ncbi:MAG: hypothetical protein NVS2B12_22730 [Ktedonobacteraceae bacterium]
MFLLNTQAETILEYMSDGFVALDTQWHYVYVNATAEAILHRRRENLLGHRVSELFPGIADSVFAQKCRAAVTTQTPVEFETYFDVLHCWMRVRARPVPDGMLIYFHDITARKLVDQQVDETLAFLVESAPFGFAFFDKDLYFRHVNRQIALMNGRSIEEHTGKTLQEIVLIGSTQVVQDIRDVLAREEPLLNVEICSATQSEPDVQRHWLVNYYPVYSITHELLGVSTYVQDITERKALEQRKDEFISMASHELRTPLTALKTMTQILKKRVAKQEMTEHVSFLERMEMQADALARLIGELLDVSKMRAGHLEYIDTLVDINALLAETVETLQQSSTKHTIVLQGAAPQPIRGDRDRLQQVFTNLLTNAIKYSPAADRIDVYINACNTTVSVAIRDYGIGIAKEAQQHIFDRFYRVQSVRDQHFSGLGIGLYIVEAIVRRHGGHIAIESEEGKGSTFSVTLPY